MLQAQPYPTRRSIAHAIITSIIKNETALETPEDVAGIFELTQVLIKDQKDTAHSAAVNGAGAARQPSYAGLESDDVAEEQGWFARIVHQFKADTLDVQFEVRNGLRCWYSRSGAYEFPSSCFKQHVATLLMVGIG